MDDEHLCKSLKRLSYISSPRYISFLYHLLRADNDPLFEEDFTMLNMLYYSLYQDTPDIVGFKNPMDFVTSLREHTEGSKEFLDCLSRRYAEPKTLNNKIDLGYECVLDLYSRYSRNEILAAFDYWNWSKRPAMREGVIYLPDKKTDLFFVTLKKTEDEYSSTTTYEDYFIDKEKFHWQSQSTTPDTSAVGQRYINHVEMGTQVLLFVREQKIKEGKSVPYVFLGKVSYVKHDGSKPMNIIWKLERQVPDEIYAELSVKRGVAIDETEIKNTDESLNNVQESIPEYHVQEGFYPPISSEDSKSSDIIGENSKIEFNVKIVNKAGDSLIVFADNAIATLKKDMLGYTIGAHSSILSQELGLSEKVLATRDSLKNIQQLSLCSFDSTLLRLSNNCVFPSFSLAMEMITGCGRDDCPTFDDLPAESVWKYSFDTIIHKSSVVVQLPEIVGDKKEMEEENSIIPQEAQSKSLTDEDELPIIGDQDSEKITLETEEDAQYLNKVLRHLLKVLGVPNASSKIIAALMIFGELPISGLSVKCNTLNKDYITLDIKAAIKRGDITFYSKANTKGRVITYYKLVHSHADIYMNLLSKNNLLVTQLSEMIPELATLLSRGDHLIIATPDIKIETTDEFKNIILKLSEIGIDRDIASVLVYLHYYPKTPFPQMFMGTSFDSSHKLKALQALYGVNWLRSTDYSYEVLHSLNLELNVIAQEYVSQHIESINLALKDLKCIIQLLDKKSLEKEDTKQLGSRIKPEMNDGENLSNIVIHSPERIVSCYDPYKEAVLEKDVLIKRVDNTLLNNNFFIIPNTILSFFNAENLSKGEKKEITLTYHRQYFKATVYKKDTNKGIYNKATIFNWDESFKAKIKENIVDYNNMPLLMITQSFVDDDEYDVEIKIVE